VPQARIWLMPSTVMTMRRSGAGAAVCNGLPYTEPIALRNRAGIQSASPGPAT
jgi:hypothetical protein